MAAFIIFGESAIGRGLDTLEVGLVTTSGVLRTTFPAVTMKTLSWLINNGTILAQGTNGTVADVQEGGATVENNGHIHAQAPAIRVGAFGGAPLPDTRIVNTGTIASQTTAILLDFGTDDTSILNDGVISARGSVVLAPNGGRVDIVNSGIMQAQQTATILASGGPFSLVNTGQVLAAEGRAAVSLSGGFSARVTNGGFIGGDVLLGDADDLFDGSGGSVAGRVDGGGGQDSLTGSTIADQLRGGAGDDDLEGNAGNDLLDGGAGADLIDGGDGRDTASYASASAAVLADLTNETANRGDARGDIYLGIEVLEGSNFADSLFGANASDTLLGGRGNDVLDGRKGADLMRGGRDDDLYTVDSAKDRVIERAGQGTDTVEASISYVLNPGAEVEVLRAAKPNASTALDLTGSETGNAITGNAGANLLIGLGGDDVLTGNAGDDTLVGGLGGDILSGAAGLDSFLFEVVPNSIDDDLVMGFVAADDVMLLSRSVFTGLSLGALNPAAFSASQLSVTAATRIIYTQPNGPFESGGRLLFDPDGSGPGTPLRFAVLDGMPAITAADFVVVA